MGTRHLIAVASGEDYKIAQYGQWDGYPSGQGVEVLDFLSADKNVNKLHNSLNKARFLEPDGVDKQFIDEYEQNAPEWSSDPDNRTDEQKRWFRSYMTRDLGAGILDSVANSEDGEILLRNSIGFAGDSLSCEYAYIIDLDSRVLEVYKGFNKSPITEGRFLSSDPILEIANGYEPVKLIKTYQLDCLPDKDKFLSDLEPDDEDE